MTKEEIIQHCFLQAQPCIFMHVHCLLTEKEAYLDALKSMCKQGTFSTVSQAVKARTIAALHITSQHKALEELLPHCKVV